MARHLEVPWLYSSTSVTADEPHRVQVSRRWLYDTLKLFNGYRVRRPKMKVGRIGPMRPGREAGRRASCGKSASGARLGGAGNAVRSRCCDTRERKGEPTGNINVDLKQRASS